MDEQLRLTTLATQIEIEREQAEPYYRMRDDFAALSECRRIWDTLDRRAINRVAERSAAHEAVTREPVSFSLSSCDLIQWEQQVPHLPNRTGGDMYIYPGFVLYRASKEAFALIDSREVTLTFRAERFIEEEPIPSDTKVVGHAWAKSNKDGSPDRRFRDNYQIPVVLYGSLTFTSPSGLHEEFQLSAPEPAERFSKAWNAFQASFAPADRRRANAAAQEGKPTRSVMPFVQTPRNATEHLDVAAVFAKETDKARTLALERGQSWEYLLAQELLRARLSVVQEEYDEFDKTLLLGSKRSFSGVDYVKWLSEKVHEPIPLIKQTVERMEQLMAACGKAGEPGDAIQILNAVNEIVDCCRAFLNWELEICSAEPPVNLRRLGATLRGITGSIISDLGRLPDEIGRAVESARMGTREKIRFTFSVPPQIDEHLAEMEEVKHHPEWLIS